MAFLSRIGHICWQSGLEKGVSRTNHTAAASRSRYLQLVDTMVCCSLGALEPVLHAGNERPRVTWYLGLSTQPKVMGRLTWG